VTAPACGCGQPTPDAYLCRDCTRDLHATLTAAAVIATDLTDAVARQLTRGETLRTTGTPQPPLPYDPGAAAARDRLHATLTWWAAETTGRHTTTIAGAAITLTARINDLRQHPQAWDAHREITAAVRQALKVIDRPPELRPAGDCEACGTPLRAEPSADTAHCQCGHLNTGIATRRAERAAACDLLGTATEISAQLALIGIRIAAGTIRMWASRGRLTSRPGAADDPWYAMSDVLVLVAERDARAAS
jgi:hypothetical protein